jgi:hypothetical protein
MTEALSAALATNPVPRSRCEVQSRHPSPNENKIVLPFAFCFGNCVEFQTIFAVLKKDRFDRITDLRRTESLDTRTPQSSNFSRAPHDGFVTSVRLGS